MKLLLLIAAFISLSAQAQTTISVEATANPGGSITVSWDAGFTEAGPMSLTIAVAWSKNITEKTIWSGVYSWWAYNPHNGAIQTSGTRTVFPPPGVNAAWANVVGNACSRTGPDMDDYECAPTVSTPVKLK
jgi:hypothetical protein